MDSITSLAVAVAPEIAKWLSGADAGPIAASVSKIAEAATGTSDENLQQQIIARDPQAAARFRLQLAQIAAKAESDERKRELDGLRLELEQMSTARAKPSTPSPNRSPSAWGAPVVSIVILGTFGAVMALALVRAMPPGSETILNMLLGSLAAMATSVVSYWVGSSAGSARKDEHLAQLTSGHQNRP